MFHLLKKSFVSGGVITLLLTQSQALGDPGRPKVHLSFFERNTSGFAVEGSMSSDGNSNDRAVAERVLKNQCFSQLKDALFYFADRSEVRDLKLFLERKGLRNVTIAVSEYSSSVGYDMNHTAELRISGLDTASNRSYIATLKKMDLNGLTDCGPRAFGDISVNASEAAIQIARDHNTDDLVDQKLRELQAIFRAPGAPIAAGTSNRNDTGKAAATIADITAPAVIRVSNGI